LTFLAFLWRTRRYLKPAERRSAPRFLAVPLCKLKCLHCFDTVGWVAGRASCLEKNWVVICLRRGACLHMAPLMPLPLTIYCSSKSFETSSFLICKFVHNCYYLLIESVVNQLNQQRWAYRTPFLLAPVFSFADWSWAPLFGEGSTLSFEWYCLLLPAFPNVQISILHKSEYLVRAPRNVY